MDGPQSCHQGLGKEVCLWHPWHCLHQRLPIFPKGGSCGQQDNIKSQILWKARRRSHQKPRGCVCNASCHRELSGRRRRHRSKAYGTEDTPPQARQGGRSCSGMVPLRRMQEANNLRLQPMHAQSRQIAEAVLVLQSSALPSTLPRHMTPRHTRTIRTRGGGGIQSHEDDHDN